MIEQTVPRREGYAPVPGGQVHYQVVGDGPGIPLLTLHGGPGAGHDYLEPLAAQGQDRPVIFFDQLGCGRSEQPGDPTLWRIERFTREVDALREALGLRRVHLLGQSWGGWLAIEYMLGNPDGVVSLTLASTSASLRQFVEEAALLIDVMPEPHRSVLQRATSAADYQTPEYAEAVLVFYQRHLCRLDPWPDALVRSVKNLDGNVVYATMNGPNEFTVTGNLAAWDRTADLGAIRVPTLITVGMYDEITPACAATLHRGIPDSRLVMFYASAHTAHLEEPERYNRVLREFLTQVESGSWSDE